MADLTKIRNLKETQLNEIAVGEIVLNVDAMTYVTKNSAGKVVPYDIDYKLPDGDATKLYLKWNNTTQAYNAKTLLELKDDIWVNGTPVNAVAASAVLAAGGIPTAGKRVTIGEVDYTFVEALTEPAEANEILLEESASLILDNLISAINAGDGEGTKYGTGTVVHPTVSAVAGEDADTVVLTAKTKGNAGNDIGVSTDDGNLSFGGEVTTLEGGIDGTVASQWDMYKDSSYIYVAIATNTIADTNWRRIALGNAYFE